MSSVTLVLSLLLIAFAYCMLYGMREHYRSWGIAFFTGAIALTIGAGSFNDSLKEITWAMVIVIVDIFLLFGASAYYFILDYRKSKNDENKKRKEEEDKKTERETPGVILPTPEERRYRPNNKSKFVH